MRGLAPIVALLALAVPAGAAEPAPAAVTVEVTPREATVGERLELVIRVSLPAGVRVERTQPGPQLGPFSVLDGGWEAGAEADGARIETWRGSIAAYRTGELELPGIGVKLEPAGQARVAPSEPLAVTIRSVLPGDTAEAPLELADLKPPATIEPDYRALRTAGIVLLVLLVGSLVAWWLIRRYGDRLAARAVPTDPFHRVPPHVWVYGELQRLLERRLAEQGHVAEFHAELSWILKRYLGGRYRVDLMEHTTSEVPAMLRQAGAPRGPLGEVRGLLERCDRVKFAGERPEPAACRAVVEEAYRIVDATRPAAERTSVDADRGAA